MINLSENATYRIDARRAEMGAARPSRRLSFEARRSAPNSPGCRRCARTAPSRRRCRAGARMANSSRVVGVSGMNRAHVVLFDWESGAEPSEAELLGPFEVLGAVTARMHLHARGWTRPRDFRAPDLGFRRRFRIGAALGLMARRHGARCARRSKLFQRAVDLIERRLAGFRQGAGALSGSSIATCGSPIS